MLTRQEFLEVILPPTGIYCVFALEGKRVHSQTFHNTKLEIDIAVDLLEEKGLNSFVAVSSFESARNRTAENVAHVRSFFLDLDCDPNIDDDKHYPSQRDALLGLKQLVKDLKLPRPMLVNSGRGIHAYWPLTEAVPRVQWKAVADRFKAACLLNGMKIDPAVPADAARVLRAVGSSNFKDKLNPLKVEVLTVVPPISFDVFKTLFGVTENSFLEPQVKRPLDDVTKLLLANKPSSFKLILQKSAAGNGCQQLLDAVLHQDTTSEPVWRAALSVAQFCKDRDKAIHAISNKHPEYSPEDTEAKAARIQGPYRCETFWKDNPKGCEGCKHKDKITSPIVLGRGEVEQATAADNVVTDKVEPEKVYVIPEYPFPFVRGKHGGIYVKSKDDDDAPTDVLVYENDFYLVNTVDDPIFGMSGLFRLHLPQDGVREFLVPFKDMVVKEKFREHISTRGACPNNKQMEALVGYANLSVKSHQKAQRAQKSRLQFGWADNHTNFIIGDRQVSATEIRYSPPSSITLGLTNMFRKKGTLEKWKEIASFYNRPGMEMHMFALFAGFSSPLVPFSKKKGGVISLYSEEAGTGKTTMLHMINSIFGHPEELMLIKSDTVNARISRMGTMQNITITVDEITNETPEVTSEFLYNYLHARGKHRLQGSANIERLNTTHWNANAVLTGNSPVEDKLHVKKRNPDGELARFLEFRFDAGNNLSKAETDAIFNPIWENFGVAGEPYMQYVIRELPAVIRAIDDMQLSIDKNAELTQRERYWSTIATTTLTGGLIARAAGVLDFTDEDFARIYKWTINMLKKKRKDVRIAPSDPATMLGAFLSEHYNDMLIIHSGVSRKAGSLPTAPIREPRGKLYIRYEPDSKLLYVNRKKFREFCTLGQVAYAGVIEAITKKGVPIEDRKMRLGKGLAVSQPENVLIFSNTDGQLFGEEDILGGNTRDTD